MSVPCPRCLARVDTVPAPAPEPAAGPRGRWSAPAPEPVPDPPPPRSCPACGADLPDGWAGHTGTSLVMAGARYSGKSIFIAVMLEQLRRIGPSLGFDVRAAPDVLARFRQHYLTPLYVERGLLGATPRGGGDDAYQREPLVFHLVGHGWVHHLVVRDVAGEDLENPETAGQGQLEPLARADCVLFLYDPAGVQQIAARVPEIVPPAERMGFPAKQVLDTTVGLMGPSNRLGVIMSKFDVVQALRDVQGGEESWSAIVSNPGSALARDGWGASTEDIGLLDAEVRSLLLTLRAEDLVGAVDRARPPGAVSYFAVSALGAPPRGGRLDDRGITPFRCLDPLAWAMEHSGVQILRTR